MTRRFGRPLGEVSLQTLGLARAQAVTYLDVARALRLSRVDASYTLRNLSARGSLQVVDRREVAGARKPVPVYRAAAPDTPPESPGILALTWPIRP